MKSPIETDLCLVPWNKGRLVGQNAPMKRKKIWTICIILRIAEETRDVALYNLAIDNPFRCCDRVR